MCTFRTEEKINNYLMGECHTETNIIRYIDIKVLGHFDNAVALDMLCDNICPLPLCNSTGNIGYIIKTLIELLDLELEDGRSLSSIKDIPIRIIFNSSNKFLGKAIAIGNAKKNKFVLIDELMIDRD